MRDKCFSLSFGCFNAVGLFSRPKRELIVREREMLRLLSFSTRLIFSTNRNSEIETANKNTIKVISLSIPFRLTLTLLTHLHWHCKTNRFQNQKKEKRRSVLN